MQNVKIKILLVIEEKNQPRLPQPPATRRTTTTSATSISLCICMYACMHLCYSKL